MSSRVGLDTVVKRIYCCLCWEYKAMYPALRLVILVTESSWLPTANGRNRKQLLKDRRERTKARNSEESERKAAKGSEERNENIGRKT